MRAVVFQPSCPLEITTLHSLGSRGGQVRGLLLLLITAVCQAAFALAQLKCSCVFSVTEGYGQQPLLRGHRGQSEISHRLATGQVLGDRFSVLVTLCLYTVPSTEFPSTRTSLINCSKFSPGWFGLEWRVWDTWTGRAGQGMA